MIGRILIERESSAGDRSISDQIDIDGLLQRIDRRSFVWDKMSERLEEPGTYRVRALWENTLSTFIGWRSV